MAIHMRACLRCGKRAGRFAQYCNFCGTELPFLVADLSATEQREYEEFILVFCNEAGHRHQVAIVGAEYCSICGEKIAP